MKHKIILFFFLLSIATIVRGQEIPVNTEQQLENQTDTELGETEDDTYLQELEQFRRNPVNLNSADAGELKQLRMVTDLQIANLIAYRNLLGKLISIYELQAVPAWDINTIRKLLAFVTTATSLSLKEEAGHRFRDGDHSLLLRVTQVAEPSEGFNKHTPGTKYLGSPQRIFFRYRYIYKNLLQFGLVGDKDAGERFLKGAQNKGFDFYSVHFFARRIGIIQSLALGDFSVNMGQGLIQWQGLAFKKSVETMSVKRQSAVLRPYSSAGEFYFHRGAGITIRKGKIESTVFASFRKLGGNLVPDTVNNEDVVSSFLTSGYHRTPGEIAERNNLSQTAAGGNIIFRDDRWQAGVNAVYYHFSLPVEKRNEPYNLFAINGDRWYNLSADYSYTHKNIHLFGEAAVDKRLNKAFINGFLLSVDPAVDVSLVQRTIHKGYQAINGNAFTENTYPTNETGLYMGVAIRPANGWRIDLYGDVYKSAWLKYGVDAPGRGKDYLLQLTYIPNRQSEIYSRFRLGVQQTNQAGNTTTTAFIVSIPKQSWRTQVNFKISSSVSLRNRFELLWYDRDGRNSENGFLGFADIIYKPLMRPLSGVLRLQYFETDGYNSRIYAYENDVLYSHSIPAFAGKGFRYYLAINCDISKKISFWLRYAQTEYRDREKVGSGLDEIPGNRKTELKAQVHCLF
jgi:hypothetical protein